MTAKGGQWLPVVSESNSLTVHFCRGVTGHALIGMYWSQFHLPGTTHCQCVFHLLGLCSPDTGPSVVDLSPCGVSDLLPWPHLCWGLGRYLGHEQALVCISPH